MLPRAITSPEHARIQLDGQWVELLACIPIPATVYTARVNGTPAGTDRVIELDMDGEVGDLADVLPGMTVFIGSSAGGYERGQARVRKAPIAGVLYIGTESELAIADNDYLTVVDEFGLWSKRVRIEAGVIYMDEDVVYAGQHAAPLPVVVMGGPVVLELVSDMVTAIFDASGSWVPGGGAATFAWSAPTADSIDDDTAAAVAIVFSSAGRHRVGCTVTIGGVPNTRYEYVHVFDAEHPPLTQFQVRAISGSKAEGGYSLQMTMFADADQARVRDRAEVLIFTRDHYGADGQVSMGYATGRENILARAWIEGETILWSSEVSSVVFAVSTAHAWLNRITAYPQGLEDVTTAPALWVDFNTLTMTAYVWHLLTWRSTMAQAVDCIVEQSGTRVIELAAAATSLWEQIVVTAGQRLLAPPCCDHLSRLFVLIDSQLRSDRSGVVEVMTLETADWRIPIQINRVTVPPVGMVDLNGFAFDGTTATALFSLSPGREWKHYGRVQSVQALLLTDQAQANALAGLIAGQANNPYPTIPLQLAANNRFLDIAPDCYALLTLAASDNPRGIGLSAVRLIPRRIGWTYDADSGGLLPSIDFEAESFAELSITGDAPAVEPVPPPPPPPDESCPTGYHFDSDLGECVADTAGEPGDGNTVYVATGDFLARTRNFLDATPNYADITGKLSTETIVAFLLDPFDPVNIGWCLTDSVLYLITDLNTTPVWTEVLHTTLVGPGMSVPFFVALALPITEPGVVYVGGRDASSGGSIFVSTTQSGRSPSVSWIHTHVVGGLEGGPEPPGIRRMIASTKTPGFVFIMQGPSDGAAAIFVSNDYGATFYVRHTEGAFHRAYDFEISYSPDPDLADRFIFWMDSSSGAANTQILLNEFGGASGPWITALAVGGASVFSNPVGTPVINMATANFRDILVVSRATTSKVSTFYRSLDLGVTWATVSTFGDPSGTYAHPIALGRWPYDPDIAFLLWDTDSVTFPADILFSTDGAASFVSKLGDWASALGADFSGPVTIVPLWLGY